MVPFKVRIEQTFKEYMISKSAFQKLVRQALIEGPAKVWIEQFLPLHFGVAAFGRYGYAPRSQRWQKIKRFGSPRLGIAPQEPPRPLEWSGDLKNYVLGQAGSGATLRRAYPIVRGDRVELRIKVPIPHPINPRNAGELTKLLATEIRAMEAAGNARLKELIRDYSRRVLTVEMVDANSLGLQYSMAA